MNEFNYKITKDVYDWIINERKNIEVRLYNEKSSKINIGDIIHFKVLDAEEKNIKVKVIKLYIENDIKTLLSKVDINDIGPIDDVTIEKLLYDIFGEVEVKNHNIIGIKFELIGDINGKYSYRFKNR